MEEKAELSNWVNVGRRIFLGFSVVVLFLFWFGILTDYSWYDNRVSLFFSILVLVISVLIFFVLNYLNISQRVLVLLICLFSFLLALASIPLHRYHSHQTPVQVETSPDGSRFVEVYCSFTPAHVTGFDHIEITVRNKNFPFLQRDLGLYNNSPQHCVSTLDSFVRWNGNNTIYIIERQVYLQIGYINWEGVLADPGEIRGSN